MRFVWNLQQLGKVIRPFCWQQKFVPKGLSAPALGLYTYIKSLKMCIKSDFKELFLKICNKWPKWQDISDDIKTLSPGGCLPLPRSYIHLINHEKMCIKSVVKVMRPFCWHQNFGPNVLSAPAKGLYSCIKSRKNVLEIRGQSYCLKHATRDQCDKTFLLP